MTSVYFIAYDDLGMDWIKSFSGISITVGSLAGIVTFAEGMLVNRPTADRRRRWERNEECRGAPDTADVSQMRRCRGACARLASIRWLCSLSQQ